MGGMMGKQERQEFWALISELKVTADRVSAAKVRGKYNPEDHVVLRGNVERIIELAEQGELEPDPPAIAAVPPLANTGDKPTGTSGWNRMVWP
jgi:hypothetical protein